MTHLSGTLPSPVNPSPYTKNFQAGLLIHLLRDKELLAAGISEIRTTDFELPIFQLIWEALVDYHVTYASMPTPDTFQEHLMRVVQNADRKYRTYISPDEYGALADFMAVYVRTKEFNPSYYKVEMPKFLKSVRASKLIERFKPSLDEGADPTHLISQLNEVSKAAEGMSMEERMTRSTEKPSLLSIHAVDRNIRVRTGCLSLDSIIDDGLRPGDLGCITACPGTGKTNVLIHLSVVANLDGLDSLFITNELKGTKISHRYLAMLSGVDADLTKKPVELWPEPDRARMFIVTHTEYKAYNKQTVIDMSDKHANTAQIDAAIASWKKRTAAETGSAANCLLVCVDWMQYLHMPPGLLSKDVPNHEEQKMVAQELGRIAKRHNVVIWTANQGKSESDGKTILRMKDQAYSYHINDALDVGIGLALAPSSRINEDDLLAGTTFKDRKLIFSVNKNRENALGVAELYQASTLRFFDSDRAYRSYRAATNVAFHEFEEHHKASLPPRKTKVEGVTNDASARTGTD